MNPTQNVSLKDVSGHTVGKWRVFAGFSADDLGDAGFFGSSSMD